jgi:hypothetical protein
MGVFTLEATDAFTIAKPVLRHNIPEARGPKRAAQTPSQRRSAAVVASGCSSVGR